MFDFRFQIGEQTVNSADTSVMMKDIKSVVDSLKKQVEDQRHVYIKVRFLIQLQKRKGHNLK